MKRLQGFIAGILASSLAAGFYVTAKNMYEKIDILYNDIKIISDGEALTPKDANGNTVEPFIYNGTTYLPVRAIAEAFDKDVAWDGDTFTVTLTSKPGNAYAITKDDVSASDEQKDKISGKWQCDYSEFLHSAGVSEDIVSKYEMYFICEFDADGSFKAYFPEESIDACVSASFEYALASNGLTEEEFTAYSGISPEDFKLRLRKTFDEYKTSGDGAYELYLTKIRFSSGETADYMISGDKLYLNGNGYSVEFEKASGEPEA